MENDAKSKFKSEFKVRIYSWVLRLVRLIDKLSKDAISPTIGNQLLRSGTSILANYIEANSASSSKDFINFFTHSLKSANESKVWLSIFRDLKKGDPKEVLWLLSELIEISNILASSIITMKKKKQLR